MWQLYWHRVLPSPGDAPYGRPLKIDTRYAEDWPILFRAVFSLLRVFPQATTMTSGGRTSMSGIQTSKQARTVQAVPAPPGKPMTQPRPVPQLAARKGREHEVRRLIRDIAELAMSRQGMTA